MVRDRKTCLATENRDASGFHNLVKLSTPAIKIDIKSTVVSDVLTNSAQLQRHRRNQPDTPHDLQVQYHMINNLVTEPGRLTFS